MTKKKAKSAVKTNQQVNSEVEAFLSGGGQIEQVETGRSSDEPMRNSFEMPVGDKSFEINDLAAKRSNRYRGRK